MQGLWTNATEFGHTPGYTPGEPISPALFAMPAGMNDRAMEYSLSGGDSEPTPWGLFCWTESPWTWKSRLGEWWTPAITDNSLPAYIRGDDGITPFTTLDNAKPYFGAMRLWPFGLLTNTDYGPTARFPALDAGALRLLTQTYPAYYYAADASLFRTFKMQSKYISSGLNTTGASLNGSVDNLLALTGNIQFNYAFGALSARLIMEPATYSGAAIVRPMVPKNVHTFVGQRVLFGSPTESDLVVGAFSPYRITLSYDVPAGEVSPNWTITSAPDSVAPRITYDGNAEGIIVPMYTEGRNVMWIRDDGFKVISETGYNYIYHSFWYVLGGVVT